MLIFFIHGVATRDVKYADSLKEAIRQEFCNRNQPLPVFYAGFWGGVLNDLGQVWNWVHQDLQKLKAKQPEVNLEEAFRYQTHRRGFLSEFVGDTATYLNSNRGAKIRELIAAQLEDFIQHHPDETDLHIITHSLGTVILWDILFSDRLSTDEPTLKIRALIQGLNPSNQTRGVCLKSITTMGSPILLLNLILAIRPETIQSFTAQYSQPLKWMNIIHSSDIIAHPIGSSLGVTSGWNLSVEDHFLQTDANPLEKALRKFIRSPAAQALGQTLQDYLAFAPMMAGAADAHNSYWQCKQTRNLIVNTLLEQKSSQASYLQQAVEQLQTVPGMGKNLISWDHPEQEILLELQFRDGSGRLQLCTNLINVHHIYVFNQSGKREFSGFVGWVHTKGLKAAIDHIQANFCTGTAIA